MPEPTNDAGTIQALLERLEKFRLPRALAVKKRVDAGELLTESDIQFMKGVMEDAANAQSVLAKHPEYQKLAVQLTSLYGEITRKALENEKAQK
jgi:hypothetical protein